MVLLCLALNPLAALAAPVYQPVTGSSNPFDIVDVGYDAAPTLGDIDGDGDLDAFVGEGFGEIYFYRNTGSPASPSYVRVDDDDNPFYGVNFGYLAAPTLVDIDNDGDLDAFIGALLDPGTQEGAVFFFRNTGSASAPVFEEVSAEFDPFNGVISGTMNKLTFGDLDGDNDLDALIGDADGLIHYFANTGSATAPYFYPAAGPLNGVDVGALASPALADMDGDGDLDALVGEEDGVLNYFRNDGTPSAPNFVELTGANNPFNGVDLGALSDPTLADIDNDGDLDALVGEADGGVFFFRSVQPEIDVRGSGISITDGDTTPSSTDGSDFGSTPVAGGQVTRTFAIHNTGSGPLTLGATPVTLSGTHAADFSVVSQPVSPVAAGASTTFQVRFDPSALDARTATVSIASNDADENPYTFAVTGTGVTPTIQFSQDSYQVNEDGTASGPAITLTRSGDTSAASQVQVSFTNGSAIGGSDFTSTPITVTFPAGSSASQTVNVPILQDTIDEPNEDLTLTLAALSNAQIGSQSSATLTILDDDLPPAPEIDVRGSSVSIADGDTSPNTSDGTDFGSTLVAGGQVTRTFAIHNTGSGPLTLGATPVSISGAHAADFAVVSQPVSPVAAGQNATFQVRFDPSALGARTATVSIASDDADENPYTFAITGMGVTPSIQFSQASYQVNEDGTPSGPAITLTRSGDTSAASQVQVSFTNGDATGGADFTSTPITVTFPAGSSASQTVSVPILQDTIDEIDETLTLTLTATSNAQIGAQSTATLTILDDDLPPTPEIDVRGSNISITDGDTSPNTSDGTDFGSALVAGGQVTRTFTIHNTGGAALTLGATPVTLSGTHAADFSITSQPASPIAAGASTTFQVRFDPSALDARTATVSIASNDADENPYTFAITGTGVTPTIVFSQPAYQVNEDGTPSGAAITLTRSGDTSAASQVQVSFTNGSASGGSDFTATPITITFPAGSSASQTVNVPITQDTVDEPNEDLTLTLTALSNAQISAQSTATLTILDDDLPPAPEIDVRGSSISIADGDTSPNTSDGTDFGSALVAGGQVTRTFTIHNTGSASLTLGGTPVTVSGAHAADFAVVSQPVSPVAAGASTTFQVRFDPSALDARTATVSIASNDADENPYTFAVTGTGVTPTVAFSQAAYQVNEDGTASGPAITLTRSDDTSAASQVQVGFTNGEATGGSDFTSTPITITFPAGSSASQTVYVPITQDTIDEPNEDLTLTLAALSNAQIGAQSTATLTILDDDLPPAPEIDVRGSSLSIADGDTTPSSTDGTDFGSALVAGGQVTRTFTIHNTGSGPLTLGATPVTVSGTHAADFSITSQPASPIAAGASTTFQVRFDPSALDARTATVSIASNDANENPYTFTVIGTGVTPTIVFSQPAYQVNEDGTPSGAAITLTRTGDTSAASQVQVSFTNGSATGGADFTSTPITITFPAGSSASQTVSVPVTQDTVDEPDETLTLTLAALSNAQIGSQSSATLTILDDDGAGYAINPLVFQVGEGETQVVSIALTSQPTASVTIHLGSSAPAQCTVTPASVVLTPETWQSGVTFSVSGVEDGLADGAQSCTILTTVSTTDPAYSALNPADLTVTISDQRHIYLPLVTR